MREKNTLNECMLGYCHLMLFKLSDYRESYASLLTASENGCAGCAVRHRVVAQTVQSDWDAAKDVLGTSDAFVGDVKFI